MIVQNLPALQVVLPLIAAPICSIIPSKKLSWFIASAVSILTLVISLSLAHHVLNYGTISYEMGGWKAPFGIEYKVDYHRQKETMKQDKEKQSKKESVEEGNQIITDCETKFKELQDKIKEDTTIITN